MEKNEKIIAALMSLAFVILLFLHIYFQQTSNSQALSITSDVSVTLFSFLMFLMVYRNKGLKKFDKESWAIIILAFLLYFIGYLIWDFYSYLLGGDPEFPSLADVAWSIFYLLIALAGMKLFKNLWVSLNMKQVSLLLIFFILIYIAILLLYDLTTYLSSPNILATIVALWYPFGDTLIILGALVLAFKVFFMELKTGLLLSAAGFLVMTIADILWTTAEISGIYYVGSLPDVLYLISYFSLSLSFLMVRSFDLFKK